MFWLNFCTTNQIFAVLRVFIGISRMCARLGWVAPALVFICIGLLFSIDSNIHDAFALSNCTYFSVRLCKTLCNCWLSFCCTNSFRTTIHRPSSSFSLPSHSKHYKHHSNIHTHHPNRTHAPNFQHSVGIIVLSYISVAHHIRNTVNAAVKWMSSMVIHTFVNVPRAARNI